MEQKLWMWICSILVLVTICNCASRVHTPTSITKCEYYNQTLCEVSLGKYGCGNDTQECTSTENDKPSYCYAVWLNNTKTNQLAIKLKVISYFFHSRIMSTHFITIF